MSSDRTLVQVAFYAALIAALGLVPPINFAFVGGVPITAQTLGVMLAGIMLGPVRGGLAVALLLFLVALGLPLLSGGRGGIGVFYGASAGYLVGWIVGAMVAGLVMNLTRKLNVLASAVLAGVIGGIGMVYLIGIPVVAYKVDISLQASALGALVYIPGDLIKVGLAAVIAQTVARGLPSALLSRA
ncbi:biotin transporter BioY [Pseudovibrio sp. Tun.PSC04-5.I4]|uniref:biotin transporter BioY n=1 Tax=Pseudovibrio sp. Tun.PSC04-5.I4 TaxID=1798213 RepID=UPI0008871E46|nr:biotin transporter BioY [Pseudovibrio sp. Tun.PSC04-5.I4]SDR30472.1 biotin transport system substrate-specific component [Pseudovibrio sp. Tun.PSC04-5.I4]